MFGLLHFDPTPLIYGVVMFLGLWSMWYKFQNSKYKGLIIEVGVFALVFNLHGGSMTGGFAAMTCALLAGFFFAR